MCGGGGSGDGGASQAEAQRQAKIKQGYAEIQRIFDGSDFGTGPAVSAPAVGHTYYMPDGTPVTYQAVTTTTPGTTSGGFGGTRGRNDGSGLANIRQIVNEGGLGRGVSSTMPGTTSTSYHLFNNGKDLGAYGNQQLFGQVGHNGGFDDAFYDQRRQAYTDFAMPQLEDQYQKAQDQLIYALARTGRLDSSTRGDKFANLQRDYDIQKTDVAQKAQDYETQARQQVENARADLVSLNNATADPAAMASQASLSASAMRAMPGFDPLAPLFQNVTEGLATQADLERRNAARYSTGLFTPSLSGGGAGRNVRY